MTTLQDRVEERRRAVAIARHLRESEGLSIAAIADRLGRSPATVKGYFHDPDGAKARAVKARYRGACRQCGAPTQPRNGKGDAYAYCKRCHPGAIQPRWTRELVLDAMRAWQRRYGTLPSSYDWSRTHARRRGGEAVARLADSDWPAPGTVSDLFGTWAQARPDASGDDHPSPGSSATDRPGPGPVDAVPDSTPARQASSPSASAPKRSASRTCGSDRCSSWQSDPHEAGDVACSAG